MRNRQLFFKNLLRKFHSNCQWGIEAYVNFFNMVLIDQSSFLNYFEQELPTGKFLKNAQLLVLGDHNWTSIAHKRADFSSFQLLFFLVSHIHIKATNICGKTFRQSLHIFLSRILTSLNLFMQSLDRFSLKPNQFIKSFSLNCTICLSFHICFLIKQINPLFKCVISNQIRSHYTLPNVYAKMIHEFPIKKQNILFKGNAIGFIFIINNSYQNSDIRNFVILISFRRIKSENYLQRILVKYYFHVRLFQLFVVVV